MIGNFFSGIDASGFAVYGYAESEVDSQGGEKMKIMMDLGGRKKGKRGERKNLKTNLSGEPLLPKWSKER